MTSAATSAPGATEDPGRRLSSEERRAQIILAALTVFGSRGYEGATTDQVARAAGVSQPYVVRLFGTKENLFLATIEFALSQSLSALRTALAASDEGGENPMGKRVGEAYVDLIEIPGLHQTLAHAFLLGGHPAIGPAARRAYLAMWRFVRDEMGLPPDSAREFVAQGMLISTMIGVRIVDDYGSDPEVAELFQACFPNKLGHVLDVLPRGERGL
ncbi:TetR/AcrR family transcriptional regulator [Microbacterium sp. MMO-10]|uniref:TetR/AcrR family transcriptional regulator n=1 Tax=Microbacterium sp. MMO-10 TaxID=3081272 RepID=UPI0030158B98